MKERDIHLKDIMAWLELDLSGERNLTGALQTVSSMQKTYINPERAKSLTVSTIHGAKGSEYERVIIGNFEEPTELDSVDIGDHNSEARVFYVAATRHIGRLVVMYNENYPHTLLTGIINSNQEAVQNTSNEVMLQQQTGKVDIQFLSKNMVAPFSRKRNFNLEE
jgi:superfamily I DNA/RNA helicase